MKTEDEESVCEAVTENGLACQKRKYHAHNGEWWDHAGGHIFAKPETIESLTTKHYDATAALSGLPFTFHEPEDCTYEGSCAWRR